MHPKLNFIVVNFNNSNDSINLVNSIMPFIENVSQIIIVDNKSEPDHIKSLQELEHRNDKVQVVFNNENTGYFKGLNIGLKLIKNRDYDYTIIGNNDLIFSKTFDQEVSSIKELKTHPVISPNIRTTDGEYQNPHVINKISKAREFAYDLYYLDFNIAILINWIARITKKYTDRKDERQYGSAQEIYQGYGACYILTPVFFKNFKELHAPTFLMYEEFFLSKQLNDKGFKIYYTPNIHVTHMLHSSTSSIPKKKIWQIAKKSHQEYRKYIGLFN